MRCQDVTRQLATLDGDPLADRPDLAAHVASCPGCAEWSRRASRLDRIWEATRPAVPSGEALDARWAQAALAIDAAPTTLRFERRARRRWVVAAVVLAQAAAVLIAALALLPRPGVGPVANNRETVAAPRPDPRPDPVLFDLVVDHDQMAVVHIPTAPKAEPKVERHDQTPLFASNSLPGNTPHDLFNAWEVAATP